MARPKDFPLDQPLRETETWSTSMLWPAPVHRRLDGLVKCAVDAGEGSSLSRAELVAALICGASEDGKQLRNTLERFRLAKVRDVVLERDGLGADATVITLESRRPGRKRSGG